MTVLNKDKILEAADDLVKGGKYDKAIREYEKIMAVDPNDMRVRLKVAELFVKRRQIPQAIDAYRKVAESYSHDGFYLKAVTIYKNILRLNPSLLDCNEALASLYEKMGLNKDAVHQYEILAAAFEHKGEQEQALKLREKLVELKPANEAYRIRLAECYQMAGRSEEAIHQYEALAEQYAVLPDVDPKRLVDLYERILPHRPDNIEMLREVVQLYHDRKDYKSALRWLESRKQLVSMDSHLLGLQAGIYGFLNQLETARGKYQDLAELHLEEGEIQKALEAYKEILVLLPEEAENVRILVEEASPGAFEKLLRSANETRAKKAQEIQNLEEEKERERETKQKEKEAKEGIQKERKRKIARKEEAVKKEALKKEELKKEELKIEEKPAIKPPPPPSKKEPSRLEPLGREELASLLSSAKTSISLAKAYQETGLEEEAIAEYQSAKKALNKILAHDKENAQAQALAKEIPS